MRDVEQQRAPEEEVVVFRTRLHAVVFAGTAGFATFVLGVVALIVARNELASETVRTLWLVGAGVVALTFVSPCLRWRRSEFAVTTRRLVVRVGALARDRFELPLRDVAKVGVERPLAGRLLGYGTLWVVGPDGVLESFPRVAAVEGLRAAVQRQGAGSGRAPAR
jgi:membrane protein YdbS with pleckstrin-like domain